MVGDLIFSRFSRVKVEQGDCRHFLVQFALDKVPTGPRLREMMNRILCPFSLSFFTCKAMLERGHCLPWESLDFHRKTMNDKQLNKSFGIECAVSSVEEHYLDTVGVTGSSPVSRTIFLVFSKLPIINSPA